MIAAVVLMCSTITQAQYRTERTGYEGDFFSLEGAIELFKESRSLNAFERKINSKRHYVNNLDLNYDGRTDYVRVEHQRQGDFHAIILQVAIDRYEVQDVAVIEIEKLGRRDVVLQIIGDEDLYGQAVIVEPTAYNSYSDNRRGARASYVSDSYVNVYYWPIVQDMFAPRYVRYVSPYRWNRYPSWYSAWRPYSWNVYYPRLRPYYRTCRVVTIYRAPRAHQFYRPRRVYSRQIARNTAKVRVSQGRSSAYRSSVRQPVGDTYGGKRQKISAATKGTVRQGTSSQRRVGEVNKQVSKPRAATRSIQRAPVSKSSASKKTYSSPKKATHPSTRQATRSAQPKHVPSSRRTQQRATPSRSNTTHRRPSASPARKQSQSVRKPVQTRRPSASPARKQSQSFRKPAQTRRPSPSRQVAPRSSQKRTSSASKRSTPTRSASRASSTAKKRATSSAKRSTPSRTKR